jgi:hypothetical protein
MRLILVGTKLVNDRKDYAYHYSEYVLACGTAGLDFGLAQPCSLDWLFLVYRGGVINNPFDL